MDSPATLADALTALNAATVRATELSGEVVALNDLLAEASSAVAERNELRGQLETLNAKQADLSQQLAAYSANAKSVDEQAALLVAAAAHPALEIAPNPETNAPKLSAFEKMQNDLSEEKDTNKRSLIRQEYLNSLKH
jgi:hypothetical protein